MSQLERDLVAMARFGGHETGVTRLAWTPELRAAYDWLAETSRGLGASCEVDAAGNAVLRAGAESGAAILVGSHLDTVRQGGRYDGALGVLAGVDVLRTLGRSGEGFRRPVWVASFMDEEGARFDTSLFGSRAFVGDDLSGLDGRRDRDGVSLAHAMATWGATFEDLPAATAVEPVDAYLELHIEQGPVLEQEGVEIGVVTSIVGSIGLQVGLTGRASHAGTTPMAARRDALVGAARAVVELRDLALELERVTVNVGVISAEPGSSNVVPGRSMFTVDARSPTRARFDRLEPAVRGGLARIAQEEQLELEVSELHRRPPVELDVGLLDVVARAAELEGASHRRLPSGAGHDAMVLGAHVPAAMLFVPSRAGVSHSPLEYSSPEHCDLGARVLARVVRTLGA